uniref:WAP domain-containing protein n=1 Tax=Podarcis muralis TaxID=64176 RepID=A0A670IMN9_PODMU
QLPHSLRSLTRCSLNYNAYVLSPIFTTEKPKNCPEKVFKCPKILRGECTHDTQCKGVKKCCFSDCALRCVDPTAAFWSLLF